MRTDSAGSAATGSSRGGRRFIANRCWRAHQCACRGLDAVALNSAVPLEGGGSESEVRYEGQPPPTSVHEEGTMCLFQTSTPGYFRAMGIPILKGRSFTDHDTATSAPVAVVDESLVASCFPTPTRSASASPSNSVGPIRRIRSRSGGRLSVSCVMCITTDWWANRRTFRCTPVWAAAVLVPRAAADDGAHRPHATGCRTFSSGRSPRGLGGRSFDSGVRRADDEDDRGAIDRAVTPQRDAADAFRRARAGPRHARHLWRAVLPGRQADARDRHPARARARLAPT